MLHYLPIDILLKAYNNCDNKSCELQILYEHSTMHFVQVL